MTDFSDQNVFQMSVAHGGPGFWIRRTTWESTCARVVGVGPFTKAGPYFGNPSVVMDVYSLNGQLREELAQVSVPGTYKTWRKIAEPSWPATKLRNLADPAIHSALHVLDRKRGKLVRVESEEERVLLTVPFERKEDAKRLGARWSPTDRRWWIAAKDDERLAKARKLGWA